MGIFSHAVVLIIAKFHTVAFAQDVDLQLHVASFLESNRQPNRVPVAPNPWVSLLMPSWNASHLKHIKTE